MMQQRDYISWDDPADFPALRAIDTKTADRKLARKLKSLRLSLANAERQRDAAQERVDGLQSQIEAWENAAAETDADPLF